MSIRWSELETPIHTPEQIALQIALQDKPSIRRQRRKLMLQTLAIPLLTLLSVILGLGMYRLAELVTR